MRRAAFAALRFTGLPFILRHTLQRRQVTILCYHDPAPADFARHLKVLTRLYRIISLRDYLAWRRDPTIAFPRHALILTFDDGHRDNHRLLDVLRTFNVPLTIFLCSGIIDTHRHFWWKGLSPAECARLKQLPNARRLAALLRHGYAESREYDGRHALSLAEIGALSTVVDFQSHTRFHPILPRCSDERAVSEIAGSKAELEYKLAKPIYAFAFPNGDYTGRDVDLVRRAGYECALTVDAGYNSRSTDCFRLRRIAIADNAGNDELVVKASGLWGLWERWMGQAGRSADTDDNNKEIIGHGRPEVRTG